MRISGIEPSSVIEDDFLNSIKETNLWCGHVILDLEYLPYSYCKHYVTKLKEYKMREQIENFVLKMS